MTFRYLASGLIAVILRSEGYGNVIHLQFLRDAQ